MSNDIKLALQWTWLVVLIYWLVSGRKAKQVQRQEHVLSRLIYYWLPIGIAIYLLGPGEWFGHTWLRENFVEHTNTVGIIGLAIAILGAVIAIASRYTLGNNWSMAVQQKQDHQLIQTGPYKWVRHPIYTGILLLFMGNAIIVGDYRGIFAVLIVFGSLWLKLRKEELLLTQLFGQEYIRYKSQTRALVPFLI